MDKNQPTDKFQTNLESWEQDDTYVQGHKN